MLLLWVAGDHLKVTPCSLQDLGSVNGTRVNGELVVSAKLTPGDTVTLGDCVVRYESDTGPHEPELAMINTHAELEASLRQATLAMSLNDTSVSRLVVKTPERTWEIPLTQASLSIGRHRSNDLFIDFDRVSRHHAVIERQGERFVLRDLGSTNGTWLGEQRVETRRLLSGDSFRIGRVQFMFKAGFVEEELTAVDQRLPGIARAPRRPVVFVPGLMGSQLWLGGERVWPNVKVMFADPEIFSYPGRAPLEPRGIVHEVVVVPNLVKLEQYSRLGDYLVEDLGYERGKDLLEFAYDWRQDVRLSAQKLGEAIDAQGFEPPITIIAHSLGTLVSRYYVERLGGKAKIGRLILMGGPHRGVPKAAASLILGPNILPFGMMGDRLREVVATFPTSYQILPIYPCALDQDKQPINLFQDDAWLSEKQLPLLRAAREFRRELGTRSSVSTLSIFGYGLKTILQLSLERLSWGWGNWSYSVEPGGDSTVPESSAMLERTEIHPVQQYHGSLFVDNDVKMRLKLELMQAGRGGDRRA